MRAGPEEGRWVARPVGWVTARLPKLAGWAVMLVGLAVAAWVLRLLRIWGDAFGPTFLRVFVQAAVLLPFSFACAFLASCVQRRLARGMAERVMEQDDGTATFVQIEVLQGRHWRGGDRGALWTEGSRIHFAGHACSFSLGRDEVLRFEGREKILLRDGGVVKIAVLRDRAEVPGPPVQGWTRLFVRSFSGGGVWGEMEEALKREDDGSPSQLPPTSRYRPLGDGG